MVELHKRHILLPLVGATLLGGCATYKPPSSSYAYFSVPCDTPGAVRAVPVMPPGPSGAGPAAAASPEVMPRPASTVPASTNGSAAIDPAQCLVAVANRGRTPGLGYYPGGYSTYPHGYYGLPFRSSLGIGIGGHNRGGHFRGGHAGGGHRGGHGGRRH